MAATRFLAYEHNVGALFSHRCSITQRFGNTQPVCELGYPTPSFDKRTTDTEMERDVRDHI